jgi:CheY-like chemotaxis protein
VWPTCPKEGPSIPNIDGCENFCWKTSYISNAKSPSLPAPNVAKLVKYFCDELRRIATITSQRVSICIGFYTVEALTILGNLPATSFPTYPAMAKPVVLVVDDDEELSTMLLRLLEIEGWTARAAFSAAQAALSLDQGLPDVVLLDVMLPDGNGMDLCRRWRQAYPCLNLLMLTARGDPIDRVLRLELGADDYLAKPFEKRELVARLRALVQPQAPDRLLSTRHTHSQGGGASLNRRGTTSL